MRRLLIVSPHFPPINAPDMQRVRMSLPHYRAYGWDPVVLAVADERQEGVREPELLRTIPDDVPVLRAGALSPRTARRLGIGHLGLRAWGGLWSAGSRFLSRNRCDLVFFSNTQFITFTLGPLWRRRFGVPYVLDVQDPWRTDYYQRAGSRRPPGGWKHRFARLQARLFEGPCFRRAAGVISVSPDYLKDLAARYPGVGSLPSEVLRFGASRTDLELAGGRKAESVCLAKAGGLKHLVYTGASGPVMPHALLVLFNALRRYRERSPARALRLRFHFIGTSYVAPGRGRPSVLPVARQCGVEDLVEEIPHRVGYLEALRLQQEADALVLLGSTDRAYSPSKVYLYHLAGPPILGLVFRDSVMEQLLDELNCAHLVRLGETEPGDDAPDRLMAFFDGLLDGFPAGFLPRRNDAAFAQDYLAEELTRRQCALFDRVCAAPAGP